jgi:hypothetical protein
MNEINPNKHGAQQKLNAIAGAGVFYSIGMPFLFISTGVAVSFPSLSGSLQTSLQLANSPSETLLVFRIFRYLSMPAPMPMKKVLLTLTATFIWTLGLACTCKVEGNFLRVSRNVDLVAVVEVKGYGDSVSVDMDDKDFPTIKMPETIIFSVIKIIKGSDHRKELRVFGDDGQLCRPSIRDFTKGKFYVIALHKCNNYKRLSEVLETSNYYSISICGQYSINYSSTDKTVKGVINRRRKITTMKLGRLETLLKED